jgi:hypothetical protein
MVCKICGGPLLPDDAFCPHCGYALEQTPPAEETAPEMPTAVKMRRRKKGLLLLLIPVVLLLAFVIAGVCTNWFGFYGPGARVFTAAKKTLWDKGSFTAQVDVLFANDDHLAGTLTMEIDPDAEVLELLFEGKANDETCKATIHNGYFAIRVGSDYHYQDINSNLQDFFDNLKENKDKSFKETLKDSYEDIEEHFDVDILLDCLLVYYRKLNSDSWLEEYAGYRKYRAEGQTRYSFDFDMYPFLRESLGYTQEAWVEREEFSTAKKTLQDSRKYLDQFVVELTAGVKFGKLTQLQLNIGEKGETEELTLDFEKVGNTQVDRTTAEDLVKEAKSKTKA